MGIFSHTTVEDYLPDVYSFFLNMATSENNTKMGIRPLHHIVLISLLLGIKLFTSSTARFGHDVSVIYIKTLV